MRLDLEVLGVNMKCDINGVKVEGTVEEIIEILQLVKKYDVPATPIIMLEPVKPTKQHGLKGKRWDSVMRARHSVRMQEVWAKRHAKKSPYSRNAPVWSVVNRNKILPPPLAEIGATYKGAWSKDRIIAKLARPHNGDLSKAHAEFDELTMSGTLQETKTGHYRTLFGVTRMK